MITRLRTLWLTAVCAASIWPTASSVPRCQANGFYQAQAFLFACDGSGGSRESNTVQVQLGAHKTQEILKIPTDTSNFMLALTGDGSADILLVDTAQDKNVVPNALKDIGKGEYAGSYRGVDIRYMSSSGAPTKEQLTFTGQRTPAELSLRIVNHEGTAADYTLGFYYFPYNGRGPQCQQGAQPAGCKPYHLSSVRAAVVAWASWLRTTYHDASTAWAQQMQPLTKNFAVPNRHWCQAWNTWPDVAKHGVNCDAAYKFVTSGGLEENIMHFYKDHFNWVMKLPDLSSYDNKCCTALRADYSDGDSAFAAVEQVKRQYHLSSQCQAMMKACSNVVPAPLPKDFCSYLGVGPATQQSDSSIMHCWKTDKAPVIPLTTSGKPLEYVPEATIATTVTWKTTQSPQVLAGSCALTQANSYLLAPVKSGDRELPVTTRSGFSADSWVIIDPGGLHQEVNYVNFLGPGSLLMKTRIKNAHAAGTKISKTSESCAKKALRDLSHFKVDMSTHTVSTTTKTKLRLGAMDEPATTSISPNQEKEIVPVTFHYESVKDKLCAGAAFTNQPAIGCNGWNTLTAQQCEDKCSNNEQAPKCPQKPCMALSYYPIRGGVGWCHLFEPGQCLSFKPLQGASSSKKVEGGGSGVAMAMHRDGVHTAAIAHPSPVPDGGGSPFSKKQVPALVGGVVGGAAVGGAMMAGVAAIVANIKGDKALAPPNQGKNILSEVRNEIMTRTTIVTTTTSTSTTTTTTKAFSILERIQKGAESSSGNKPTVPLVCLGLLVVFGLCALCLAALLDPCHRKKRKIATLESGSVASVGSSYSNDYAEYGNSVASVQSMAESDGMYQPDQYDQYGNPIRYDRHDTPSGSSYYDTPSGSSYDYDARNHGYVDYNGSAYSNTSSMPGYPYDVVPQQDSYREGLLSPVPEGSLHSSSAGGSFRQPAYGSQSYMVYR